MSMGNRASAPPSKGGAVPPTNPQVPNPYGDQGYQPPQRYSNDYFRYQQSGDPFNQPVMGYGTYGQIFTPPPPRFQPQPMMGGKGGGMGYRPFPPVPPPGGKGGGMSDMQYRGPQQPPTMGGKGQPQNQGPFMSYPGGSGYGGLTARPGSGPPRVPRTRQLGLNNEPSRPAPPDVQVTPPPPQVTGGVPQEYAYPTQEIGRLGGPGPTLPNLGNYFEPGRGSVASPPVGGFSQPIAAPVTADVGINQRNPAYQQQQQAALNIARQNQNVPPQGYMLNPNYNPARSMQDDVPLPGSSDALSRQQFIPSTGGLGLGGMPSGGPQISPDYMPVMGARNFDIQPFGERDNYIPRFGNMGFFQEGGQVPPDAATNMEMMLSEAGPANPQAEMSGEYDRLIQMTMQAVLGQVEQPDEIIQMFIDEFGVDAFRQLRDAVLKSQVPNAQTEGMVDGNGGGMDDQVMGMIGAQRPVAVSPGEYIIPADVVSGLGDGSSKSGADILDELSQAVRMTRTGTTEQPRPLMETLSQ